MVTASHGPQRLLLTHASLHWTQCNSTAGSWTCCWAPTPASLGGGSSWRSLTCTGGWARGRWLQASVLYLLIGCVLIGLAASGRQCSFGQVRASWVFVHCSSSAPDCMQQACRSTFPLPCRTSTGMGGPLADDEFNVILGVSMHIKMCTHGLASARASDGSVRSSLAASVLHTPSDFVHDQNNPPGS